MSGDPTITIESGGAGTVVPSVSIENMVNMRAAVISKLHAAYALIEEASNLAAAAHLGMPRITLSQELSRSYRDLNLAKSRLYSDRNGAKFCDQSKSDLQECTELTRCGVDAAGWQYLMTQSGMRSLMDATARADWDKKISDGEYPELTAENIKATFSLLHGARGDMFERGVIQCFKNLSWNYKTNCPFRFRNRIVMRSLTGEHSYNKNDELDDLLRVFHVLDGKPEPDYRGSTHDLLSKAGIRGAGAVGTAENDYLHVRTFKNTNGHVTFKRLDLVERMNDIITKHYPGALPHDRHTEETP